MAATLLILALFVVSCQARTAFEKMTDVDYQGETYYTIRNLSLYECQGWCREEVECQAASFSFVANGLGQQETVCLLQNGTQANNPTSKPIQALNQYYMVKMSIRSDKVCKRPWNFERVPNSIIQGHDRALIFTSTKEACLAACLNERNFVCRSAEYNYVTLQCRLSDYDRRTLSDNLQSVGVIEAQGVDYFENLCLNNDDACANERSYQPPRFGQPAQKVAAHVKTHFYVDKELMANSMAACNRACTVEAEFLCRSFLFLGPPTGTEYNCKLYHMDHWSLPDGVGAFLNSKVPTTIADGSRIGNFYENRCEPIDGQHKQPKQLAHDDLDENDDSMLCKTVVTRDRRYITQITCYEKGSEKSEPTRQQATRPLTYGKQTNGGALASLFSFPSRSSSLTRTRNQLKQQQFLSSGQLSIDNGGPIDNDFGSSIPNLGNDNGEGINPPSQTIGGNIEVSNVPIVGPIGGGNNGGSDGTSNINGVGAGSNGIGGGGGNNFGSSNLGIDSSANSGSSLVNEAIDPDINCDRLGTCYDVSVHCKDTRIVVNVNTNQPFSGRIYALGRSETCNVDVINSDSFRLDLTMSGQDCNTQSVAGVYTNTVVVQRHSVVMTKTDKIYKVRCTYDTTSRNITFGMMPIRDPDMISITSAPEAPAPKIRILDTRQQEVETVRIGDRLTFRIEIPDKTPYGIFARSCVAMAKDARSTFPIIDDQGCPSDPSIFPRFTPEGNALLSVYEAFRFTESYGVIFQCNVKYCLGPCQPVSCTYGRDDFESWGRRRKRREVQLPANVIDNEVDTQMRLSHEIIVLDFGDEKTSPFDFDAPATSAANHNGTDSRVTRLDWNEVEAVGEEHLLEDCPTRASVMGLAVACALLVVLYLCTVFCLCIRPPGTTEGVKACVLPPEHVPGRNSNAPTATLSRQYVR